MFDVGFWELVVIGVVALVVIGPERLPAVARTVGIWVGRARRFVNTVQTDIRSELDKAEELKRLLEEQTRLKETHEILEQTVDEAHRSVATGKKQIEDSIHSSARLHESDKSSSHNETSITETPLSAHQPQSLIDEPVAVAEPSSAQASSPTANQASNPASNLASNPASNQETRSPASTTDVTNDQHK